MIFEEKLAPFGFNTREYMKRFDDTPKLYQECLELYIMNQDITRLSECIQAGDWENAQKYAHTLKGGSSNLALMKLWKLYSSILTALRGPEPESSVPIMKEAYELEMQLREIISTMKKIRRSGDGYTHFK